VIVPAFRSPTNRGPAKYTVHTGAGMPFISESEAKLQVVPYPKWTKSCKFGRGKKAPPWCTAREFITRSLLFAVLERLFVNVVVIKRGMGTCPAKFGNLNDRRFGRRS
jgi:hypothetical protein